MLHFFSDISPFKAVAILIGIGFHIHAMKLIFKTVRAVLSLNMWSWLAKKLTPKKLVERRTIKEKVRRLKEEKQKEVEHQIAREDARKYRDSYFNIGFITKDRAELFAGHEEIKWEYGRNSIDLKHFSPDDSRILAFKIFQEMAVYRWQFIENSLWSPKMESFWNKILPKQFKPKEKKPIDFFTNQLKKAEADFDSDVPIKFSA